MKNMINRVSIENIFDDIESIEIGFDSWEREELHQWEELETAEYRETAHELDRY